MTLGHIMTAMPVINAIPAIVRTGHQAAFTGLPTRDSVRIDGMSGRATRRLTLLCRPVYFEGMGTKGAETRQRMIEATKSSIERRGYFGTGLNQILAESGTPRGSLYFHFPGGKDELVAAAIGQAAGLVDAAMANADLTDPATAITDLITLLGDRLEASGWESGCPVATVALEIAGTNETVQRACAQVYDRWTEALRIGLHTAGHRDADDLAGSLLALIEGALLLARTQHSREPLERAARTVRALL